MDALQSPLCAWLCAQCTCPSATGCSSLVFAVNDCVVVVVPWQLVYSTEKLLTENKDKIDASSTAAVEKAIADVKAAREAGELKDLRDKIQALQAESMKIGQAMYKNAGAAGGAAGSPGAGAADEPAKENVVDADFKEKDGKK